LESLQNKSLRLFTLLYIKNVPISPPHIKILDKRVHAQFLGATRVIAKYCTHKNIRFYFSDYRYASHFKKQSGC
jgi:hypothetical protein